jgi:fructuronate reductase/mannitol 2-dehydrogenase
LAAGLERRRTSGLEPFTVLSCDNLPRNGQAARRETLRAASEQSEALVKWVAANGAFPNSVVDRITPESTAATRQYVARRFGIGDRCPVVTEPFSQWIVEDAFCNERPPLDAVGGCFVADVSDHELTKKRLLNGGHCALGYLGWLLGHRTTDEAMADPLFAQYIERLLREEISPLLRPARGLDLASYRHSLLERFANASIGDRLERLCARGSTKVPAYLLPSIVDADRQGRPHRLLALALAGWMRYLRGFGLSGEPVQIEDVLLSDLQPLALAGGEDPGPLLGYQPVFGDLGDRPRVVESIERALHSIERDGLEATLGWYAGAEVGVLIG